MNKFNFKQITLGATIVFLLLGTLASSVFSQTKPISTPIPKPEKKIIVNVTAGRVRSMPNTQSETLKFADIGTIFTVVGEKNNWSNIEISDEKSGWISNTITTSFDDAKRGKIYQEIAEKYLKKEKLDLKTASELLRFLPKAADEARTYEIGGDLRLKRLFVLRSALDSIPSDKTDKSPYKEFLKENEAEVVYSEPSGEWYVRSDVFWELRNRYAAHKIGDDIAWQASLNPVPGECEGYINCHIYLLRATAGEYLNFYPNGKHSKDALNNLTNMLEPLTADASVKRIYYAANDTSDRADFNKLLTELRAIVAKLVHVEKNKTLAQIQTIAEGYR